MNFAHRPFSTEAAGAASPSLVCFLLSLAALLIHGYHPYAEDAGIYIPAIKKQLDPALYPHSSEFFMLPAHWSVFTRSIAVVARISHLDLAYLLLLCYVACLFLTLLASWKIAQFCFLTHSSGLLASSLVAATITMPAAGCALLLYDPYVTSRSISTPLILFAILRILKHRYFSAWLCWIVALAFHPLMALICALFLALLLVARSPKRSEYVFVIATALAISLLLLPQCKLGVSGAYRTAVLSRSYFFLNQWTWYELFGAAAPLFFFLWMAWKYRQVSGSPNFQISFAVVVFGMGAIFVAAAVTWIPGLLPFARFQPLRAFQLIYLLFLLLPIPAVLREITQSWLTLRSKVAAASMLVALAAGMYVTQRHTFPSSRHLEWPWSKPDNGWQQAFAWVRVNTPKDALFALDPNYANSTGDDRQGFRAQAERSALPDRTKDGGVAALFPEVAADWRRSINLTSHVANLNDQNTTELREAGVSWILVPRGSASQLDCPYMNSAVSVCRLNGASNEALKSASIKRP
jgi:hypothetical protein